MTHTLTETHIEFRGPEGQIAGVYVLNDLFKPHFRELYTPAGHPVTMVSPIDHRHHKGLMYALKTTDVNFWEEDPGSGHCGVQDIQSTTGTEGGFRQEILWREEMGGLHTYQETRSITCRPLETAYEWTWHTRRTALRDHELDVSFWLLELEDGRNINYHGLGIRLPWAWCWGGKNMGTVECDGQPVTYQEAAGTTAKSVGFSNKVDGHWTPPVASVTIEQNSDFGWFAFRERFPYLSVGPTILGGFTVSEGETFDETYRILVADRPALSFT